ncbi:MAG: membrane protein [Lysobacteraceae bacterium]|nr:MAG: membrane protein [Xanthomonadaceae bacterium]
MHSIGTPALWTVFALLVALAIAADLWLVRASGPHRVSAGEALKWSLAWVLLAALFNLGLWWYLAETGPRELADQVALEFLTGYLVEKALAVDNIFVFLMLFTYFSVPPEFQKRALILGVIGAIVLRAVLIFVGAALVARFHWVLYLFGLFLVITGFKMLLGAGQEPPLEENPILRLLRRRLPLVDRFEGEKLWLVEAGRRVYTPLFVVLLMIGITDVIFAVDSIPAVFAITTDPFVVLTSNVFAVLGLRALYFLLADLRHRFHLLVYGLALVLIFIGAKMLLMDVYRIPIPIALSVVAATITTAMVVSLMVRPQGR